MKKLLLSLISVFFSLSASATDIWVWHGGEYIKTTADSITFVDPSIIQNGGSVDTGDFSLFSDYTGTLKLTVMGFAAGNANPTVSISEVADGIAKVAFAEFSASGYTISGFAADNVVVTANADGSYTLSQTNFTTTANLNGEEGEVSKCNLAGTVSGNGAITLTISFTVSSIPVGGSYSGNQ
ncbi:MAG: calycin-like domain-containing protein [Paludibacteraceae bacterium]|nr:calycin-like domain-containing protein [Paludibacteraceae bacterium]